MPLVDQDSAVEVFRLNTELFPEVANYWASYGEALPRSGKKEAALGAYKKALSLDSELPSAREAVVKLERK